MHIKSGGSGVCRDGQRNRGTFEAAYGSGIRGYEDELAMVNAQIAATDSPSHRYHCAGEGRWLCSAPFRIFRPASSNTRSARTSQAGRPVGGQWVLYTRGNCSAGPTADLSVPCSGCVTDAINSDQIWWDEDGDLDELDSKGLARSWCGHLAGKIHRRKLITDHGPTSYSGSAE